MKISIQNRYWVIPNHILNDSNLTFKAKGLYWYIQSKPDDWDFSIDRIKFDTKESRDWIRTWMKELEDAWYLVRNRVKNSKGQFEVDYFLYEQSTLENPMTENTTTENPTTVTPTNNKERNTKKEIIKKDIIIKESLKEKIKKELSPELFINDLSSNQLQSELENFHDYWTESRMKWKWWWAILIEKWQEEKFFEINKRFRTWINNNKKWNKNSILSKKWNIWQQIAI